MPQKDKGDKEHSPATLASKNDSEKPSKKRTRLEGDSHVSGRDDGDADAAGRDEMSSDRDLQRQQLRVESMGWITESTVMPRKGKAIDGVGTSSLVELRAQLYRSQEEAKRAAAGEPVVKGIRKSDLFARGNLGVEERARRDMLQLKAEEDGSHVRAALEKKAALYEKIRRGELPDEEQGEKYSVDFLSKGLLEDEKTEMEEQQRRTGIGAADGDSDHDRGASTSGVSHKALVREVNEETVAAREEASELKQQRALQAKKRQDKLKAAFMKKQMEKLQQLKAQKKAVASANA